jgi:phospholipid/cholesterol/gamma-HCH transport system ATP-binding protein
MAEHFIEFRHVTKSFDDLLVLDDVSFTVDRAETCVILGRSGVGKSVSLKHMLGFLKPDAGEVWVAGEEITGWNEEQLTAIRKRVAMVFQSGALFDSLTVRDNVAFPLEERKSLDQSVIDRRVDELLEMLEVSEYADRLPADLSTGMKRAVAIARVLAQDPEAILYDEPTTMVDPIMAGHMGDLIRKLKDTFHKTSVVVTHDTHLAKKLADRVVFLHQGRVAYFGPWAEFEATRDPFQRNFLLQDALVPALDQSV